MIVLQSLSYLPYGQFYLSWVSMAPLLVYVAWAESKKEVFFMTWLAAFGFFFANMWWLVNVTLPGTLALLAVMAFYWSMAALVIRACGMLDAGERSFLGRFRRPIPSIGAVLFIPAVWVAFEFLRGYLLWGGLPWLYIGHSQTPCLPMCQIADITGALGVSYWVMAVNTALALVFLHRKQWKQQLPAVAAVLLLLAAIAAYGFHIQSSEQLMPGPTVAVLQPNFHQTNSGKGVSEQQVVEWVIEHSDQWLAQSPRPAMMIWPETILPPVNQEFLDFARGRQFTTDNSLPLAADQAVSQLARKYQLYILSGTGSMRVVTEGGKAHVQGMNSAILYIPQGNQSGRYDKIHLVPFGEFIPFKDSVPLLYQFFNLFNPYSEDYTLLPGREEAMTVFRFPNSYGNWTCVTPICFEDLDADLVAEMFCPPYPDDPKRANFLVNLTNDGWFDANENILHYQTAVFRSIENRVSTARSVNTGVSGFIDPLGRLGPHLGAREEGIVAWELPVDSRITYFTRHGNQFAWICAGLCGLAIGMKLVVSRSAAGRRGG